MNAEEIKQAEEFINDNSPEAMTTPAKPEFPKPVESQSGIAEIAERGK